MPEIYNIYEAKTNLSKLVEMALAGQEVYVAKNGTPLIELKPLETAKPEPKRRKLGDLKGKIWIADDFDEMTPELLEMFGIDP